MWLFKIFFFLEKDVEFVFENVGVNIDSRENFENGKLLIYM